MSCWCLFGFACYIPGLRKEHSDGQVCMIPDHVQNLATWYVNPFRMPVSQKVKQQMRKASVLSRGIACMSTG